MNTSIRTMITLVGLLLMFPLALLPENVPIQGVQQEAHTGPAPRALVVVEVLSTSKDGVAQQLRRANGMILRCDGFILAPSSVFSKTVSVGGEAEPAATQRISVVLEPGTPG